MCVTYKSLLSWTESHEAEVNHCFLGELVGDVASHLTQLKNTASEVIVVELYTTSLLP